MIDSGALELDERMREKGRRKVDVCIVLLVCIMHAVVHCVVLHIRWLDCDDWVCREVYDSVPVRFFALLLSLLIHIDVIGTDS